MLNFIRSTEKTTIRIRFEVSRILIRTIWNISQEKSSAKKDALPFFPTASSRMIPIHSPNDFQKKILFNKQNIPPVLVQTFGKFCRTSKCNGSCFATSDDSITNFKWTIDGISLLRSTVWTKWTIDYFSWGCRHRRTFRWKFTHLAKSKANPPREVRVFFVYKSLSEIWAIYRAILTVFFPIDRCFSCTYDEKKSLRNTRFDLYVNERKV